MHIEESRNFYMRLFPAIVLLSLAGLIPAASADTTYTNPHHRYHRTVYRGHHHIRRTVRRVAVGAAGGAAIGAVAGGGPGAAIGAVAGGTAGAIYDHHEKTKGN
jgi:outer membrane lipoprotein SlyB